MPWCDFKVFRKEQPGTRDTKNIFIQALRRLFLLNKEKRSQINTLRELRMELEKAEEKRREEHVSSRLLQLIERTVFRRMQEERSLAYLQYTFARIIESDEILTDVHAILQKGVENH